LKNNELIEFTGSESSKILMAINWRLLRFLHPPYIGYRNDKSWRRIEMLRLRLAPKSWVYTKSRQF